MGTYIPDHAIDLRRIWRLTIDDILSKQYDTSAVGTRWRISHHAHSVREGSLTRLLILHIYHIGQNSCPDGADSCSLHLHAAEMLAYSHNAGLNI